MAVRLLDTNIVSYIFKGHELAKLYRPHLIRQTMAICFMTEAELFEGAIRELWGADRRAQPIGTADAWIAAAAVLHDCELVTHDPRDYANIAGLQLISETSQ